MLELCQWNVRPTIKDNFKQDSIWAVLCCVTLYRNWILFSKLVLSSRQPKSEMFCSWTCLPAEALSAIKVQNSTLRVEISTVTVNYHSLLQLPDISWLFCADKSYYSCINLLSFSICTVFSTSSSSPSCLDIWYKYTKAVTVNEILSSNVPCCRCLECC